MTPRLLSTPNGIIALIPQDRDIDAEVLLLSMELGDSITHLGLSGDFVAVTTTGSHAARLHLHRFRNDHVNPSVSSVGAHLLYRATMWLEAQFVRLFNRQPVCRLGVCCRGSVALDRYTLMKRTLTPKQREALHTLQQCGRALSLTAAEQLLKREGMTVNYRWMNQFVGKMYREERIAFTISSRLIVVDTSED